MNVGVELQIFDHIVSFLNKSKEYMKEEIKITIKIVILTTILLLVIMFLISTFTDKKFTIILPGIAFIISNLIFCNRFYRTLYYRKRILNNLEKQLDLVNTGLYVIMNSNPSTIINDKIQCSSLLNDLSDIRNKSFDLIEKLANIKQLQSVDYDAMVAILNSIPYTAMIKFIREEG